MGERLQQLQQWLGEEIGTGFTIEPASGDASFRRYFRVAHDGQSYIAMDAPPPQEDVAPFVAIARRLLAIGLHVPRIVAESAERGFLLLSDLGSDHYLDRLSEAPLDNGMVDRLYGDALEALATLQACGPVVGELPPYDRELLLTEMGLFRDWLVERHLGITLSDSEQQALAAQFERLADSALEQPQVAVHRDYHSRNLMVHGHNPGILDFQDAVIGPVTYDLVSLLRDCYIAWPRERVEAWVAGYHETALHRGILRERNGEQFLRWFDLMGVQRHLKASGIFARLNHRDGKPGYLADIPRTLGYIEQVAADYPELAPLQRLLAERVLPALRTE